MQLNTIQGKKARGAFEQAFGNEDLMNRMYEIIKIGKLGLDGFVQESLIPWQSRGFYLRANSWGED